MFMRILLVSATAVALTVPAAQSAPLFPSFNLCTFAPQMQCASNATQGSGNKAKIEQFSTSFGIQIAGTGQHGDRNKSYIGQSGFNQLALTIQDGNDNNSYTGQKGSNEVALTFQQGNGNTAGTHENGSNMVAASVQSGNGSWSSTSMNGNGAISIGVQSN